MAWAFTQWVRAHAGRIDDVRAAVAANPALAAAAEPLDSYNVEPYCALIEIADRLRDAGLAARPYSALRDAVERGVVVTGGLAFVVPRILGLAAALNGWWNEAEQHFQEALAVATQGGLRPELARTYLDYAAALTARNQHGDRQRASELLQRALHGFHGLEMRPFVERANELAATLQLDAGAVRAAARGQWSDLTERQAQILNGVARGRTDTQIADDLLLRTETVARFVDAICISTGATRQTVTDALRQTTPSAAAPEPRPEAAPVAAPFGLSAREVDVLRLLAAGKSNREIAEALVLSVRTIETHVIHILTKTQTANRTEAAIQAYRSGLMN
jgi:DNA-binding NarL/FixJ family response regulator